MDDALFCGIALLLFLVTAWLVRGLERLRRS